jgi:hypothetical protein
VVRPRPQVAPPAALHGEVVLHVTARYLDAGGKVEGHRASYHEFPAEEWLVLSPAEAAALAPREAPKAGLAWEVDPVLASRLYRLFCPVTGNWEPSRNRIQSHALLARVVSVGRTTAWVRLEGRLSMTHSFYPGKDDRTVDASILGFVQVDSTTGLVRSLRLITEKATYGKELFGVAVRNVR